MKPHMNADPEIFAAFQENWILENVTIEDAMLVPSVANLIIEEFNNKIIDDFDEENEEV